MTLEQIYTGQKNWRARQESGQGYIGFDMKAVLREATHHTDRGVRREK